METAGQAAALSLGPLCGRMPDSSARVYSPSLKESLPLLLPGKAKTPVQPLTAERPKNEQTGVFCQRFIFQLMIGPGASRDFDGFFDRFARALRRD